MIAKAVIAIAFVALLIAIPSCADAVDNRRCQDAGERLGAKPVLLGGKCFVNGYGRIF